MDRSGRVGWALTTHLDNKIIPVRNKGSRRNRYASGIGKNTVRIWMTALKKLRKSGNIRPIKYQNTPILGFKDLNAKPHFRQSKMNRESFRYLYKEKLITNNAKRKVRINLRRFPSSKVMVERSKGTITVGSMLVPTAIKIADVKK